MDVSQTSQGKSSRRAAPRLIAASAAIVVFAPDAAAQTKVCKAAVKYQDAPKDGQRCSACIQLQDQPRWLVRGVLAEAMSARMSPMARLARALVVGLLLQPLAAPAEERIEGVVRDAVVTHCDATRRGGCAGTLSLERSTDARTEVLTIRVPLGTPISRGAQRALLHTLEGQRVIVTQTTQRGELTARAIQVAEPPLASPAAGPGACDVC